MQPDLWRYVRIIQQTRSRYQLATFICHIPFNQTDKAALGIEPELATDNLTLEEAVRIGQVIEDRLAAQDYRRGLRRDPRRN